MEIMPEKTGLKILIGRSSQCDFVIENPDSHRTVSAKHATIYQTKESGIFILEDHSTNGTYVNGLLINNSEHIFHLEDHLTLGKSYELDVPNIVSRYLANAQTTKKKQPPHVSTNPVDEPIGDEPTRISPVEPYPSNMETVVNKIPSWFWILYVCSVVLAFCVGLKCA